ncbi:MAG TPA: DNA repair protein RadA [Candidatus Sulfotelmatobacter sp.]|nr:DNA repair protein RadA [Candidatus Sulfotelmatobacter sp.]
MAKQETSFVCQECGYDTPKFLGKCPECGLWNTLKEIRVGPPLKSSSTFSSAKPGETFKVKKLSDIVSEGLKRFLTGFSEMDNVLGGGVVPGSVTLLAGDPGVGKSTILLQTALKISSKGKKVLYISGEESEQQIKLRAVRLTKNMKNDSLFLASLTNTDEIVTLIESEKPALVIIDSIQTMESENLTGLSGSVGQIRYSAGQFIRAAKTLNIPTILVGHVTKEGMVAGPMILSHMVDTVLFLEGEKNTGTRILRSLKNRFGPIDEVGIFAMQEGGMEEVLNPEHLFLNKGNNAPGSVLVANMEGTRAFLVEIQALLVFSKLPMPRRVTTGVDYKRLELLLAVLQKHGRVPVEQMDVFVNVAGGLKLNDPGCDLGICLAILSSIKNINLSRIVGVAEVGLLGELRTPPFLEKRVKEAKKLGFSKIITPKNYKSIEEVVRILVK